MSLMSFTISLDPRAPFSQSIQRRKRPFQTDTPSPTRQMAHHQEVPGFPSPPLFQQRVISSFINTGLVTIAERKGGADVDILTVGSAGLALSANYPARTRDIRAGQRGEFLEDVLRPDGGCGAGGPGVV